jgi:hypothetical protein
MTTAWLLFLSDPAAFQPMDDGLKPLAFHHQVHVSLGLGEAAFAGLPANRAVLVRIHAVRNAVCLRDRRDGQKSLRVRSVLLHRHDVTDMCVRGVRRSGSRRSGMGMLARERGAAERESTDGHPDCCVKRCSHLCPLGGSSR